MNCLFGNLNTLKKSDFIKAMGRSECRWIFDERDILERMDKHTSDCKEQFQEQETSLKEVPKQAPTTEEPKARPIAVGMVDRRFWAKMLMARTSAAFARRASYNKERQNDGALRCPLSPAALPVQR